MAHDPFELVEDAPLFIVPRVLDSLRAYRAAPVSGALLAAQLDAVAARLLAGVERHPTKFWVLKQFRQTLDAVEGEDEAVRTELRAELERLMDILGIGSSDGMLGAHHR